jgi:hypothetical protein
MKKIEARQHSKIKTGLSKAMFWALATPMVLCVLGVACSGSYPLVLREDTISPVVGAPRSLVYLSLAMVVAHLIFICYLLLLSRRQASESLFSQAPATRDPKDLRQLFVLFGLFAPFTVAISTLGVGQDLNGWLDFSQPRTWQTKVIGLTHLKVTPYIAVQDWQNPNGVVYLMGDQTFLKRHPARSTLKVTTKRGLFGHEWYVQ